MASASLGYRPADVDLDEAARRLDELRRASACAPAGLPALAFDPATAIVFDYGPPLPGHANGLALAALDAAGEPVLSETYYSVGGGFVVTAASASDAPRRARSDGPAAALPFDTAAAAAEWRRRAACRSPSMKRRTRRSSAAPDGARRRARANLAGHGGLHRARAVVGDGDLPGGLRVKRAGQAHPGPARTERGSNTAQPHVVSDWLNVYAMAVNEENAAGGKVVTAPTNGAAGVVPAVIRYYLDHCVAADPAKVPDFLLTAAAVGGLIKHNASISGAEAGCQGEVGSASAMAAAGLCAVLGGTPAQVENAAEIALEHHLGMTCDPVAGLVQVPCIERNGIGATKAVAAASLALRGDGSHFMPLDNCIDGDAADRGRDERQVQGDEPRRLGGEPAGMLNGARWVGRGRQVKRSEFADRARWFLATRAAITGGAAAAEACEPLTFRRLRLVS